VFQRNAFQNNVSGAIKGFQVAAGVIRDNDCLLEFETDDGNLILEDGSGFLALEICEERPPSGGGAGYIHYFSRRRWRELMLALEAEERAIADIRGSRTIKQQEALQAAIDRANAAILAATQAAETAQLNAELIRLAHALDAAVSASRVTASIKAANKAFAVSNLIIAQLRREQEEEEELMQVLLLTLH